MRPYEPETQLFAFHDPSREEALSLRYRFITTALLVIGVPLWLASAAIMVPAVIHLLLGSADLETSRPFLAAAANVCATFLTLYAMGRRHQTQFARLDEADVGTTIKAATI